MLSEPTQICNFELGFDQSDWISFSFSHFLLSKYNGMLRLGGIESGFEVKSCKQKINTIKCKTSTVIANWLGQKSVETKGDIIELGLCQHAMLLMEARPGLPQMSCQIHMSVPAMIQCW